MENMTAGKLAEMIGGELVYGDPEREVSRISIDSRDVDQNTLFVPLKGERVDAHRFLADVASGKASCVLFSEEMSPCGDAAWIRVKNTYEALIRTGVSWRERMYPKVVAVTGSVGKTTTREMVATALSAGYRTFRTQKNYNSDIGVPIMLSQLSSQDEAAVLELGMSDFGEMEKISQMARPDTAVITNIGVAHIAQLKTRENICKEKLSVTKGMKPGSLLILNGDDDLLSKVDESIGYQILFYGLGAHNDYRAEDIVFNEGSTTFRAVSPNASVRVTLPVTGTHMVMNALAALAAAEHFGVDLEAAATALAGFEAFSGRQQIYSVGNFKVIDDTYNASPDSMKAALGVLTSLPSTGRRIAVLSNMLELGENERLYHQQVGEFAGKLSIDELICVGELASEIGRAAEEKSSTMKVMEFACNDEASAYLKQMVTCGDLLLFKGSNSTRIGQIIQQLKEEFA